MTREELMEEIMQDPSNQLYGLPIGFIQRMICEYKLIGVDPYKVVRLEAQLREFDRVIDEEGIAESCINPLEDLRIAIRKLKSRIKELEETNQLRLGLSEDK